MKIYVLIDFSDYSNSQIQLANHWCLAFGCKMVLVHQLDLIIPSLGSPDIRLKLEYDQKRMVFQEIEKLREQYVDESIFVNIEVTALPLIKFLKEEAQIEEEDIILAGIKGTGILKQIFIGSTVTRVIEEVNRLTIALPLHIKVNVPSKLVVAVHYKTPVGEKLLKQLIKSISSKLEVVEFITIISKVEEKYDSEAYLLNLKKTFDSLISCQVNSFSGNEAMAELKSYMLHQEGMFLVLQKGSRSLADRVFRKFMINDLVYDASIPLIVLPS
ncbi:universal stress protein [Belliella pelovolcani]|uniref:universal stress protein n=1 Tax=Belliella pelovolcani TaxID=529505 RepID=UPI00391C7519